MKHNIISLKEALTLLAQTIRQPGWDLEAIETRLDILMKESEKFEKELRDRLEEMRRQSPTKSPKGTPSSEPWMTAFWEIKEILGEGDS